MLSSACPDYWVFDSKGIFNIGLLFNPHLSPPPKKNGICKDGKRSPSLSLSKLNVMKVVLSLSTCYPSVCFVCLPVLIKD